MEHKRQRMQQADEHFSQTRRGTYLKAWLAYTRAAVANKQDKAIIFHRRCVFARVLMCWRHSIAGGRSRMSRAQLFRTEQAKRRSLHAWRSESEATAIHSRAAEHSWSTCDAHALPKSDMPPSSSTGLLT